MLSSQPDHLLNKAKNLFTEGTEALSRGNLELAESKLLECLSILPDRKSTKHNLAIVYTSKANAYADSGAFDEALAAYEKALDFNPRYVVALSNYGVILNEEFNLIEQAIDCFRRALIIEPGYSDAHQNLGVILAMQEKFTEALNHYDRALAVDPESIETWINRGNTLHRQGRLKDALTSFDHAIKLDADFPEAWAGRSITLNELRLYSEALEDCSRALKLRPDFAEAWCNRGTVLRNAKRYPEALASYENAIKLQGTLAEAWLNYGITLVDINRYDVALDSLKRAISLNSKGDYWHGRLLHTQMQVCEWADLMSRRSAVKERVYLYERVITPFGALGLYDSPGLQQICATVYAAKYSVRGAEKLAHPWRSKTRIAYFSADFHDHATMHLMIELFERHDKSCFEVYGFSFGPDIDDEMRQRVKSSMREFVDISRMSDGEAAALARDYEIDIAIDLKGYTQDSRPQIFAERVAPIQISYLGYPGTMGTTNIDYLIADRILIPEHSRSAYSEKIIYMPNCYQVNSRRRVSEKVLTREEAGLPAHGFVFCCFNNNWKILPEMFDCWMRILKRVDGSVMWLFGDNEMAASNLRKEAQSRDIAPSRIVFAKRIPNEEHLARYRLADLFLDTFPYNAHTTASDALWVGTPILTLEGATFASRVAASILHSIELPELITRSIEDYESLAVQLALDPARLAAIKANLERNKSTAPLFDTQLFTEQIESAYQTVYKRLHNGLLPDYISI